MREGRLSARLYYYFIQHMMELASVPGEYVCMSDIGDAIKILKYISLIYRGWVVQDMIFSIK